MVSTHHIFKIEARVFISFLVEVQQYTIWVYRYIASFVSQYSDMLDDTVQCVLAVFTDEQNFFPKDIASGL